MGKPTFKQFIAKKNFPWAKQFDKTTRSGMM